MAFNKNVLVTVIIVSISVGFCSGGPVVVQLSLHIRELLLNENDMVSIF